MLEVKDLYRVYKPKKGQPVVALDRVSIKFPDTGLVFILGKSGSGKSTLLNVMGGLDKSDGGDIIIKGKSSVNFKQGDFDSYRNTYLGFIFQEYNILDEFNVGQNIALAIELQGRKATSKEINEILEEVDLKGYGNRKTNELSGGQKQRVAIARALVKDPDIIFADEPTGALDSKTGLQVFDTLKKLSEKKLVVVVSHDREFAELYGDRVIELADGKVISDIEKISVAGEKKSEGVTLIDQSVIRVKKDYELTDEDMAVIKKYLNDKKNQERLISLDDNVNGAFKRITRIDDFGNKESFTNTDESKIVNKQEAFKSIKSRLSLKKCFRIGGSSLKTKPFRLVITILLSIVAFGMFGLADTMGSYDKVTSTTKSIVDLSNDALAMEKIKYFKYNSNDTDFNDRRMSSTDDDIKALKDKYGIDFKGVYKYGEYVDSSISFWNNLNTTNSNNYYSSYVTYASGLYVSDMAEINKLGYSIIGTYPQAANEIAITKTMYESFKKYGYREYNPSKSSDYWAKIEANALTEDSLKGNTIYAEVNGRQTVYKITGIIDTGFDRTKYSKLDVDASSGLVNDIGLIMLRNQLEADYKYNFSSLFFTNQSTVDLLNNSSKVNGYGNIQINSSDAYVNGLSTASSNGIVIGTKPTSKNQILVSLNSYISNNNEFKNEIYSEPISQIKAYDYGTPEDKIQTYYITTLGEALNYVNNKNALLDFYDILTEKNDESVRNKSFADFYNEIINAVFSTANKNIILNHFSVTQCKATIRYNDELTYREISLYNDEYIQIVGLYFDGAYSGDTIYLSEDTFKSISSGSGKYAFLISSMPSDESLIKRIVEDTYSKKEDGLVVYCVQNGVMPAYRSINSLVETLSEVFLYVGIGFAVFASLMLFNFITISISYKKREIGILRAVGARSRDVFNIFFAESFIIAMISFAFAITLTFVISMIINNSLVNEYNLMFTLLTPGIRQVGLVLAVSIGVAFISTFIPVYKIAMKRPIDAIRDR